MSALCVQHPPSHGPKGEGSGRVGGQGPRPLLPEAARGRWKWVRAFLREKGPGSGVRKLAEAGLGVCLRGTPSSSTWEADCVLNHMVTAGG